MKRKFFVATIVLLSLCLAISLIACENDTVDAGCPHEYEILRESTNTCSEDGFREKKYTLCGETEYEVIPAAHTLKTEKGYAATCTRNGLSEKIYCEICEKIIQEHEVITAKGHAFVTDKAVEATCKEPEPTDSGYYWHYDEANNPVVRGYENVPIPDYPDPPKNK